MGFMDLRINNLPSSTILTFYFYIALYICLITLYTFFNIDQEGLCQNAVGVLQEREGNKGI